MRAALALLETQSVPIELAEAHLSCARTLAHRGRQAEAKEPARAAPGLRPRGRRPGRCSRSPTRWGERRPAEPAPSLSPSYPPGASSREGFLSRVGDAPFALAAEVEALDDDEARAVRALVRRGLAVDCRGLHARRTLPSESHVAHRNSDCSASSSVGRVLVRRLIDLRRVVRVARACGLAASWIADRAGPGRRVRTRPMPSPSGSCPGRPSLVAIRRRAFLVDRSLLAAVEEPLVALSLVHARRHATPFWLSSISPQQAWSRGCLPPAGSRFEFWSSSTHWFLS